jgi:aldehyde:ferredoxin oxidoreductase
MTTLPDLLGVCKIFYILSAAYTEFTPDDLARIYSAATGINLSGDQLFKASERVYNLEQSFNVKVGGFSRKNDVLPERLFKEKVDGGPSEGKTLSIDKVEQLLDDYYEARGWNRETTSPTRKTLEALDLQAVADDLEK